MHTPRAFSLAGKHLKKGVCAKIQIAENVKYTMPWIWTVV
jgi:hypothetical protein